LEWKVVDLIDLNSLPEDLIPPPAVNEAPSPGKRVWIRPPGFHVEFPLYLPTDWQLDRQFPVIIEYPGNGNYHNALGDCCTGRMEDCALGYGIGGGSRFLWACLPFVSPDSAEHQLEWWGDVDATLLYCAGAVDLLCSVYGGDRQRVFLAGFSRGSIACNFIGLHTDEIASIWRGFICHSHYDGVYAWPYPGCDEAAAIQRLLRLGDRPQWISHEATNLLTGGDYVSRPLEDARQWLSRVCPTGQFTFRTLPFLNHTDRWVLRDIPERDILREWINSVSF